MVFNRFFGCFSGDFLFFGLSFPGLLGNIGDIFF